jgi:hypothetical protein
MSRLSSRLGVPTTEGEAERTLQEERDAARRLEEQTKAAAGRLDALASEARDDEVEALRAASEDAKALARQMRQMDAKLKKAGESGMPGQTPSEKTRAMREMASEVRGLEEDAQSLRARIERRAAELLKGREGEGRTKTVDQKMKDSERALSELARRFSRNQPPRPTNAFRAGAEAYQIVGEGIVRKIERIIKQREYQPPENEEAPADFRDLVDRYFRALSED